MQMWAGFLGTIGKEGSRAESNSKGLASAIVRAGFEDAREACQR